MSKNMEMMSSALSRCEDMIDLQGWRYSKDLGMDEYKPIDLGDGMLQDQFGICVLFLDRFFGRPSKLETVSSLDLRDAIEVWWFVEKSSKVYIETGILLLALIAKGYAPEDLWLSMEPHQQAHIPVDKWEDFCAKYDYTQNVDWEKLNDYDDSEVFKIADRCWN